MSLFVSAWVIYFLFEFSFNDGFLVFGDSLFRNLAPLIVEIVLEINHDLTEAAMSNAAAVFVGIKLSQKKGFSLASCLFSKSTFLEKIDFGNRLSVKSSGKKIFTKISWLWLGHFAIFIVSLLVPASVTISELREYRGSVLCVEYGQQGTILDRKWPTIETVMGTSEYAYGDSIGYLRYDHPYRDSSLFLMAPQLTDTCAERDIISGHGHGVNLKSDCNCITVNDTGSFENFGIDTTVFSTLFVEYNTLNRKTGFANHVAINETDKSLKITTLLSGSSICDSTIQDTQYVPVCSTKVWDLKAANVRMEYMTDGTPASIAAKKVELESIISDANITWLGIAYRNILGGEYSASLLPSLTPGTINSVLWWTSTRRFDIHPALLEFGMEGAFSIIARSAIHRSFSATGSICSRSMLNESFAKMKIAYFGFICGVLFVTTQIIICIACLLCYIPWIISKNPLGPAVRAASDLFYFENLICRGTLKARLEIQSATIDR
jgi:hypothetical protein